MFLPASNDTEFQLPPSGAFAALCIRIIDIGTQKTEYQGQTKLQRKLLLTWELPDEKMEDGRPFAISQRFTFSSNEKATLRKMLESWRGKAFTESDFGPGGFDIKAVLGKPCLLSVIHATKGEKTYANIASISALPKGMVPPMGVHERIYFSLEKDRFDGTILSKLSEGLQKVIRLSPEYAALTNPDPHRDYVVGHDEDPGADSADGYGGEPPF